MPMHHPGLDKIYFIAIGKNKNPSVYKLYLRLKLISGFSVMAAADLHILE